MRTRFVAYLVLAAVGLSTAVMAKPLAVQTSVSSRVAPEYQRKVLPNGMPEKELYALSNGGMAAGTTSDSSVEKVSFPVIAGVVAEHLGRQNYFLAPDSKSAQLLLVIQWGRTIPHNGVNYASSINAAGSAMSAMQFQQQQVTRPPEPGSSGGASGVTPDTTGASSALDGALMLMQMEDQTRQRSNEQNARLLGYVDAINDADGIARYAGGGDHFKELVDDIEEPRYYVLVRAYEFRAAVEKRESKLLWVTRISVAADDEDFDQSLRAMVARAAPYFGRPTGKLIRDFEGKVELGEASVIEVGADLPKSDSSRGSESAKESK
jgi:hypothetical protein